MSFFKLQPASQKELRRIAIGSCVLAAIQLAVFFLLHLLKVVAFDHKILLGTLGGVVIELFCFTLLCLFIQRAVGMENGKPMKAWMQLGYNMRMFIQAGWVLAALLVKDINILAAAIPLIYPTIIVFFLRQKGVLAEPSERKNPENAEEDDPEEDHLNTFEV